MKKILLLPLICAMLLAFCGGRSAHAFATPLIDSVSPAEYVNFVNKLLENPSFLSTPVYDTDASQLAGHDVYTTHTANNVIVSLHTDEENLSYMNITFDEDSENALGDVSSLTVATYIACGMTEDEAGAIIAMESVQEGNAFVDRGYCSATQRMITERSVFDGASSSIELSASPN